MPCFSWKTTTKKRCKTATPFLTKWAVSFSPCIVKDCVWLFSLSWLVKNIYIYRTFLVTLALRHLTKLNHGRRKFAAHFRIFKFHVQVMPGLCIRFSYSVFWNRKAVIRLVIFSFNLPWIDMVKKRKVICMLNYLTKCWTPFLGQRFLKLDFCISDTPHSLRAFNSILSYATKG